ncbi:MAG: hypothetical protein CM1200mP32_04080 [Methanobacteriota archaeon]|nr:MAG: hypothetical protein CM1200mP32_04080 [Euryarchaeota archaeon]
MNGIALLGLNKSPDEIEYWLDSIGGVSYGEHGVFRKVWAQSMSKEEDSGGRIIEPNNPTYDSDFLARGRFQQT